MVASDGYCGTPLEPASSLEGWQTATDRRNRRNQVGIKKKISNLVQQALREANGAVNRVPEVAPPTRVQGMSNRSQTTGNPKTVKPVSETEPNKKKRWRRMRSWRPLSSFPSEEERKLLNKNVNTMSKWYFDKALAEYKRNGKELEEINQDMENTLKTFEKQASQAEHFLV